MWPAFQYLLMGLGATLLFLILLIALIVAGERVYCWWLKRSA